MGSDLAVTLAKDLFPILFTSEPVIHWDMHALACWLATSEALRERMDCRTV